MQDTPSVWQFGLRRSVMSNTKCCANKLFDARVPQSLCTASPAIRSDGPHYSLRAL